MNNQHQVGGRRATVVSHALRLLLFAVLSGAALAVGCRRTEPSSSPGSLSSEATALAHDRELLQYAVEDFIHYERYDSPEWLQQAVGRFDQWVKDQKPLADWEVDPLAATLPEPLDQLPDVQALGELRFPNADVLAFLEAIWLRDVSNRARGDAADELGQAKRLFDWTVRNIQLASLPPPDPSGKTVRVLQRPWETILTGQGTAVDRAWVFMLLARQQGIDAALIALVDADDKPIQTWCVAVLSRGELYLFEPTLGLPIPAPGGVHRDEAGRLEIEPATLAQVAADDALLRQLDVAERPYPVKSSQIQRVVVQIEGSPAYLSQRMRLIESQLAGDDRVVLSVDASAQAERFEACEHVVGTELWDVPYRTLFQERQMPAQVRANREQRLFYFRVPFDVSVIPDKKPQQVADDAPWWDEEARLRANIEAQQVKPEEDEQTFGPAMWRGRLLYFKGELSGENSATYYYTRARVPNRVLEDPDLNPFIRATLTWAKIDAGYWLGVIAEEQGNTEAAIDWLRTRTLEAFPDGPRTPGAKYNLGRVYEADGQIAEAAEAYRSDADSPARPGNLLRARWLQPESAEPPAKATEQPPPKATEPPADEAEKQPEPEGAAKPPPEGAKEPAAKPTEEPPSEGPRETPPGAADQPSGETQASPPASTGQP